MRFKKTILILFVSIFSFAAYTQTGSIINTIESRKPGQGKVKIVQNNQIEQLLERRVWEQSKKKGIMGYRIRIFSDSGQKSRAGFEETKARFISNFDIPIYGVFKSPSYKIYVGDFRTRSEALKVLKQIEKSFPAAFIVPTEINYPNLDIDE